MRRVTVRGETIDIPAGECLIDEIEKPGRTQPGRAVAETESAELDYQAALDAIDRAFGLRPAGQPGQTILKGVPRETPAGTYEKALDDIDRHYLGSMYPQRRQRVIREGGE